MTKTHELDSLPPVSVAPKRPRNGQLWFDADEADRAVAFFRDYLVHTDGLWAGRPFRLTPWQEFEIIRPLFGWMRWSSQWKQWVRRYSRADIWLPRGNGKSEIAAGIALLLELADGEAAAEVYGAAEDRDQAGIIYRVAAQMVRLSPVLSRRRGLRPLDSVKRIVDEQTGSFYRALPRDEMGTGSQGFRVHGAIIDEYHVQKSKALTDALRKGMGKRTQPLYLMITTAGADPHSPEAEEYAYAKKVLAGEEHDPNLFVYIREAPEDADPFDEAVWFACNPALGDFLSIETLREEAREARAKPSELNAFLQYRLNRHVRQVTRYIPMDAWDATAGMDPENDDLSGRSWYAGLDTAAETGIAAFVLVGEDDEGTVDVVCRFWVPGDDIEDREKRDRAPYRTWEREGRIEFTDGNVIDYAAVKDGIEQTADRYPINEVGYRRFGATQLVQELDAEGFTCIPIISSPAQMAEATKYMLDLILSGRLRHGGHPVLRWMADALVVRGDHDGNIKPDQRESPGMIPGMLALVRALDRAMRNQEMGPLISVVTGPALPA